MAPPTETDTDKPKSLYEGDEGLARQWLKELNTVLDSADQKKFEADGDRIIKKYRNFSPIESKDGVNKGAVMFNILWVVTNIQKAAVLSRVPKPVVERYFKDHDKVGRLAALGAERAVSYMVRQQEDRIMYAVKSAVEDRFLPGRGQVSIRYGAEFEPMLDPVTGAPVLDEDGDPVKTPKPNTEQVFVDPLNYLDYLESPARNQYEVRWRSKRAFMGRKKLIERFGDVKGKACELNYDPYATSKKGTREDTAEFLKQAEVWEIEDLDGMRRIWVSEGYKEGTLDVQDDHLRLKNFYTFPIPLLATTTTDNQYPVPDYKIWERLADELDYVTNRISGMVECVRFIGLCAESVTNDLKKLMTLKDGQAWPMKGYAQFMSEKGGLASAINWFPFENAVNALGPLQEYQGALLSHIFETFTGIPDIVRGATDPNETLGAQREKVRWVGIKSEEKAQDVARFFREIISKMGEIIFEPGLFSDETINLMVGVEQMTPEQQADWPAALALLRSDRLRTFRVDIQTDSTVAMDEASEQARRMEFLGAWNQAISNIQSMQEFRPELVKPTIEASMFAIEAFRAGRQVTGSLEASLDEIQANDKAAAEQAAQEPPPPDYEAMKAENESQKVQVEAAKIPIMQQELALKEQELALKGQECGYNFQLKSQEIQQDGQAKLMELEIKAQSVQNEAMSIQAKTQIEQIDQELKKFKEEFEAHAESQRLDIEKFTAVMSGKEKLLEEKRLAVDTHHEAVRLAQENERIKQDEREINKPEAP